jgi:hypothetical protein
MHMLVPIRNRESNQAADLLTCLSALRTLTR